MSSCLDSEQPFLNTRACPEEEEEEQRGRFNSEWLYQSCRRLPEEELRGELFGLRVTATECWGAAWRRRWSTVGRLDSQ